MSENEKTLDRRLEKIGRTEIDARSVAALSTTPTRPTAFGVSGLSAADLKARFDMLPEYIVERFNELLDTVIDGELADALMIKGQALTVGEFIKGLLAGERDVLIPVADGKYQSLYTLCSWVYENQAGLITGMLAEKINVVDARGEVKRYKLNKFVELVLGLIEALESDTESLEKDAEEWRLFKGGEYARYYSTSMPLLDEKEENNKYINFSDLYNRVYVHLSGGRGDYGRFCLTESPTPPNDPDGTPFEHGGGKYFGVANNRITYDAQSIEGLELYYGVVMNAEAQKYSSFGEDMTGGQYLVIDKTGGGGATITFKNKGDTRKKCIFETEMYINVDNIEVTKPSDNWFLRFDILDDSGASAWGISTVRMCYTESKGVYWYGNESIKIPQKKWFSLRIESVGENTTIICDGFVVAKYKTNVITSFDRVKAELRTKTYVNNVMITLDNTCVHSNNELETSGATLSSVAQRTKQGHLRVPEFKIGEEPSAEDLSYRDSISVPLVYVESMQNTILAGLERIIAAQTEILGGDV